MTSIAAQLTFMAGSLARTPFRQQVETAAAAGFDSISIWPNIWRHALRKDGLTLADMSAMLRNNGLTLTDGDAIRDWVPAPRVESAAFGPIKSGISRHEFFEVVNALGGTTVVAVHLTDSPLDVDRDTEAFAQLCDDAAAHGLRVALEFVSFSNIRDAKTAMRIVNGAGRANGGLVVDIGHHRRGGGSDAELRQVPGDKVYTVQLLDGPSQAPEDIVKEAVYGRQLPGDGEFDVTGFVRMLGEMGVRASVGPELYDPRYETRPVAEVARELMAATRRVLDQAAAA